MYSNWKRKKNIGNVWPQNIRQQLAEEPEKKQHYSHTVEQQQGNEQLFSLFLNLLSLFFSSSLVPKSAHSSYFKIAATFASDAIAAKASFSLTFFFLMEPNLGPELRLYCDAGLLSNCSIFIKLSNKHFTWNWRISTTTVVEPFWQMFWCFYHLLLMILNEPRWNSWIKYLFF